MTGVQTCALPIFHIDAQGAEYRIFSAIGDFKPKVIWAEVSEFNMYKTGVTYTDFCDLLSNYGYSMKHKDKHDALYILNDFKTTDYYSEQKD